MGPTGCHSEGTSSASLSKLCVIYDKTKWMFYPLSENAGSGAAGSWDSAQELEPDVFSYHRAGSKTASHPTASAAAHLW